MIVAFSISPTAADASGSVSEAVAAAVRVVRESGLPNETNAMFTNVEGEWDEVMAVVKRAVDVVAEVSPRVGLVLKADIRPGYDGQLTAKVERIEYDPNRSAHIALVVYADGERRYVIAPRGLEVGSTILSGAEAPIKAGNTLPIRNIPVGSIIHCVEMLPGKGAQIARSAGAHVTLLAREGAYAQVRLRSGEVRRIHIDCRATIGEVSNEEHSLRHYGKAGAKRWKGIRPTVRGVAMNPVDHPHGGGEGRTSGGRHPVTPWGKPTKGKKTRSNKSTDKFIMRSRHARKS